MRGLAHQRVRNDETDVYRPFKDTIMSQSLGIRDLGESISQHGV